MSLQCVNSDDPCSGVKGLTGVQHIFNISQTSYLEIMLGRQLSMFYSGTEIRRSTIQVTYLSLRQHLVMV